MNHSPEGEYIEVMQYLRFLGNLRFAGLTVFIAITAGLLTLIFKSEPLLKPLTILVLKIGGVLATLTFWIAELSVVYQWRQFVVRAVELEQKLNYKVFSRLRGAPKFRFMPTSYFVSLLYCSIIAFWLTAIIWPFKF